MSSTKYFWFLSVGFLLLTAYFNLHVNHGLTSHTVSYDLYVKEVPISPVVTTLLPIPTPDQPQECASVCFYRRTRSNDNT